MIRSLLILIAALAGGAQAVAQPVTVPVTVAPTLKEPLSGRLLLLAERVRPGAHATHGIDTSPFHPNDTVVIGRDIGALRAGATTIVDAETDAFPAGLSQLPPGRWRVQAVLDRHRDYNYSGRGEGDVVSDVVETSLPGQVPPLVLSRMLPARTLEQTLALAPPERRAALEQGLKQTRAIEFASPRLSAFWARPIHMRGWVALPPGYDPNARTTYPVVYFTHGFGGDAMGMRLEAATRAHLMEQGHIQPMIWVMLDQSSATGTHEFADSVNNGPWGTALTTELLPMLERSYRMDKRASGRFLTGHSSGGWATLWLQVRYPELFGGTWSTAPDPSDFHDFTGIDIYRSGANAFTDAAGQPIPLVRDQGRVMATVRDFSSLESAIGPYGGQLASFEWVFSPRGPDGRPMPLFDRTTGAVDPLVAAHWRDNYDIAHIVARDWQRLRPHLRGKIRVIVGDADTFYLDQSARRLEAVLERLGADARFTYVPGGTHFNIGTRNGDPNALTKEIAREMYAIARPRSGWTPRTED
jgi:enterochelin esterase-like enzyme